MAKQDEQRYIPKPRKSEDKKIVASNIKSLLKYGYETTHTTEQKCTCCNKVKDLNDFYNSYSESYRYNHEFERIDKSKPIKDSVITIGQLTVCKECLLGQFKRYYKQFESVSLALRLVCQQYDIYYNDKVIAQQLEKYKDNVDGAIGRYFTMVNSLKQFFEKTYYKDTINEETLDTAIAKPKKRKKHKVILTDQQLEEYENKYGFGYTDEEYANFEKRYKRITERGYNEKTSLHSEKLISYIIFKVKGEMELAKGNISEADKLTKLAQKEATDGKLNVSQLSKSDISGGIDVTAQIFEAVEDEAGVIPWLPQMQMQPNDEADLILWANINYARRLEDKPAVQYRDIWNFYNDMLDEFFDQQGYTEEQKKEFMNARNSNFRDLQQVYLEPVYEDVEFVDGDE